MLYYMHSKWFKCYSIKIFYKTNDKEFREKNVSIIDQCFKNVNVVNALTIMQLNGAFYYYMTS